ILGKHSPVHIFEPGDFIVHYAGLKSNEFESSFAAMARSANQTQTNSVAQNRTSPLNPATVVGEMRHAVARAKLSRPTRQCDRRGIVIYGGGVRYFTNAWISISVLRDL